MLGMVKPVDAGSGSLGWPPSIWSAISAGDECWNASVIVSTPLERILNKTDCDSPAAALLLQKGSWVNLSIFPSFTPAFSPSLASAQGSPISVSCGNSVARSHFASASHWPLTFVRDACSGVDLCSLCGLGESKW